MTASEPTRTSTIPDWSRGNLSLVASMKLTDSRVWPTAAAIATHCRRIDEEEKDVRMALCKRSKDRLKWERIRTRSMLMPSSFPDCELKMAWPGLSMYPQFRYPLLRTISKVVLSKVVEGDSDGNIDGKVDAEIEGDVDGDSDGYNVEGKSVRRGSSGVRLG